MNTVIKKESGLTRKVAVGDVVIIISYAYQDFEEARTFKPALAFPDENNLLPKR